MAMRKNLSGRGSWVALTLLLAFVLTAALQGADLRQTWAKGGDWQNVTVVYTTDIKGKIEPCG